MSTFDCLFRAMDRLLDEIGERHSATIVDMHAEATSEKAAIARYLDGRVSVIAGTHTHVPTADVRILPKRTAFVTDVSTCGPVISVIGIEPRVAMDRFLTQTPHRLYAAKHGPTRFNGVLFEIDESIGKARGIERIDRELPWTRRW